jgi:hypothetical protein
MTERGSKAKKGGKGRRVSIYLPGELAKKLLDKPGINLSRVVRRALAAQFEGIEDVDEYGSALARVRELEVKNFAMSEGLAAICRSAAKHAGLVVLSQDEWDKATERQATTARELREATTAKIDLEVELESLSVQLEEARDEAKTLKDRRDFFTEQPAPTADRPEDFDPQIDKKVDAAFPRDGTCGKCEYLSFVDMSCSKIGSKYLDQERSPDDQQCEHYSASVKEGTPRGVPSGDEEEGLTVCGNPSCGDVGGDTVCKGCGKPLCWSCYAGDSGVGEPAVALCDECLAAPQAQEVSGDGSGPTSGEEGATADPEPPPSPEETTSAATSDRESSSSPEKDLTGDSAS